MWGTIFKVLLGAAAVGLVAYGTYKIHKKITAKIIAEEARKKSKEAFRTMVTSATRYETGLDLFNLNDEKIGEMTLESDLGVDSSIREGQVINLY